MCRYLQRKVQSRTLEKHGCDMGYKLREDNASVPCVDLWELESCWL